MSISALLAWAQARWLPSGQVDVSISTVKRIALIFHFICYLLIPLYQLDRLLRLKYDRRGVARSSLRFNLELKAARYLNLVRPLQDEHGFIMADKGDSLLFTGLAGAAGLPVDILAARDSSGQWFRRPLEYPRTDASTISRDMLIGLLWYCWRKKKLDTLEFLWYYGTRNNWVMGTGDASRICMMPPLQGTLALMIAKLGGKKHFQRFNPQLWNPGLTGFEAHLQILHICLMGEIEGRIDGSQWSRILEQSQREPNNPLFMAAKARYIDGDMTACENSLADTQWWPEDRLPTRRDRVEPYLPQRDYGEDWLPASDNRDTIHSGCDLLFCLSV